MTAALSKNYCAEDGMKALLSPIFEETDTVPASDDGFLENLLFNTDAMISS